MMLLILKQGINKKELEVEQKTKMNQEMKGLELMQKV